MKNTRLLCGLTLLGLLAGCSSHPIPNDDQWEDYDLWSSGFNNHLTKDNKTIPDTLQRIEQYSNGVLFNVAEYDKEHRLIFRYYKQDWGESMPGQYGTMIAAYVYKCDRLIKSYYLHSNIGLTLNCYDYNWFSAGAKCYSSVLSSTRHEDTNTNPFRYLEKVTSYQALLSHPKVLELERQKPRHLSEETVYGPSEQVQEELYYNGKGEIDSRVTYYYNNHGLLTRKQYSDERPNRPAYVRQFIREYNPQKQLAKEYYVTDNTDTAQYKQYSYDQLGRVATAMHVVEKVERSELTPEPYVVFDKLVLQYDAHNAIRQIAKYTTVKGAGCGWQCEDKLDRLITYTRNKEGFILESSEDDCKEDTTTVTHYNYVYKGY